MYIMSWAVCTLCCAATSKHLEVSLNISGKFKLKIPPVPLARLQLCVQMKVLHSVKINTAIPPQLPNVQNLPDNTTSNSQSQSETPTMSQSNDREVNKRIMRTVIRNEMKHMTDLQ